MSLKWHPEALLAEMDRKEDHLLELCSDNMLQTAVELVPVDTGALQDSLRKEVDVQDKSCYVGSDLDYSVFVEYGSRNTPAQPYLRPAFDELYQTADSIILQVSTD